jgi:hypothetical protein
MSQKVTKYCLIVLIALLSLSLIGKNSESRHFKEQMSKFAKSELQYVEELDKNGNMIIEQEQLILTQKDAIEQGLLEIEGLKKVNSQVIVVTNTIVDTIIVSHTDTVISIIDGESYLKLPQKYSFSDDFVGFKAEVNTIGLRVDNISILNESTITIGYEREGLFKPLKPIVKIKNTNPYMITSSVSNVVIEEKTDLLHDKRAWGVVGFVLGILIK